MKKTKISKRVFSSLLAMVLVLTMMPIPVLAETKDKRTDALDVTSMMETDKLSDEGWAWYPSGNESFNYANKTLVLDGIDLQTEDAVAVRVPAGTTIILADDSANSIVSKFDISMDRNRDSYGIYCDGDFEIKGNGASLMITGGDSASSYGIRNLKNLKISGSVDVIVASGSARDVSIGIFVVGTLTVSDNANVVALGGIATESSGTSMSFGIDFNMIVVTEDGKVTTMSSDASGREGGISSAIRARAESTDITVIGGTVVEMDTLTRDSSTKYYYKTSETPATYAEVTSSVIVKVQRTKKLDLGDTAVEKQANTESWGNPQSQDIDAISAEGWAWYPNGSESPSYAPKTLVLDGIDLQTANNAALCVPDGTTIILADDSANTVVSTHDEDVSYGIWGAGKVTITGNTGSLSVSAGDASTSNGILAAEVDVSGNVELAITSGQADSDSKAIKVLKLTVSGNAQVTAVGNRVSDSYGIYASQNIFVTEDGKITAMGNHAAVMIGVAPTDIIAKGGNLGESNTLTWDSSSECYETKGNVAIYAVLTNGVVSKVQRTKAMDLTKTSVEKQESTDSWGNPQSENIDAMAEEGWAWYFDGTTINDVVCTGNVLVLDGINLVTSEAMALKLPDEATIVSNGTNIITTTNSTDRSVGLRWGNSTLTIKGEGNLTITSGSGEVNPSSYGVEGSRGSTLNVESGIFTAIAGNKRGGSIGLSCSKLNVTGGTVNAIGGNTVNGDSIGIDARSSITLTDGMITAKSGGVVDTISAAISSDGILTGFVVKGGDDDTETENLTFISASAESTGLYYKADGTLAKYAKITKLTIPNPDPDPTPDPTPDTTPTKATEPEVDPVVAPTVEMVRVTPSVPTVIQGKTKSFTAKVIGTEDASKDVTWSVEGNTSSSTVVSADGVLTVGKDEKATSIIVKATSKEDNTKSAYATVKVAPKKGTTFTAGNYIYIITNDNFDGTGTVTLTGVAKGKTVTTVNVPETAKYKGVEYDVTAIGEKAFYQNKDIKKATIGNNVTVIGKNSFRECPNLTEVTVGDSVVTISYGAFYKCTALKKITIGTGLQEIGNHAFCHDKALETIIISSTKLKKLGDHVLYANTNLTIKVPSSKVSAYEKMFTKTAQGKKVVVVKK